MSSEDVAIDAEFERGRGLGGMMAVLCGAWMGLELCAASINGVAPFLSGWSIVFGNARHRWCAQEAWECVAARWRGVDESVFRLMSGAEL